MADPHKIEGSRGDGVKFARFITGILRGRVREREGEKQRQRERETKRHTEEDTERNRDRQTNKVRDRERRVRGDKELDRLDRQVVRQSDREVKEIGT